MQDGHRPVVAVVDDDAAVRESLRFLLEIAGYEVATFGSACEFLHAGEAGRQACVLVDQHMPQVTGLELLRRLRGSGRDLPVALMTGSPSAELTRQALELGGVDVLEKPLAEEVLFRFVERSSA
jgi:two-component system, LuxR family, response regulator FixJ